MPTEAGSVCTACTKWFRLHIYTRVTPSNSAKQSCVRCWQSLGEFVAAYYHLPPVPSVFVFRLFFLKLRWVHKLQNASYFQLITPHVRSSERGEVVRVKSVLAEFVLLSQLYWFCACTDNLPT